MHDYCITHNIVEFKDIVEDLSDVLSKKWAMSGRISALIICQLVYFSCLAVDFTHVHSDVIFSLE